ncbi:hypothetical protein HE1_00175 [Holospora elegans E1]|uniref:Uncharacterized protein n=1 Tax=Holospora elegans E1 TaxID=1427503 RepID=A0A023DY28_9PROT|nr:hypothetical protein [Holospora elegans]GAJ45865.1 hypothetical protein HE1_00175 [Holospora elegans E1]
MQMNLRTYRSAKGSASCADPQDELPSLNASGVFLKGQGIDSGLFSKALISSIWEQVPKMHLMLDGTN